MAILNRCSIWLLSHVSKWFHANQLILNVEKTTIVNFISSISCTQYQHTYYCNTVKFTPTDSLNYSLDTEYVRKRFTEVTNIRFVGVKIGSF
jgi:hypothetical protein